jgi:hypothetical protein
MHQLGACQAGSWVVVVDFDLSAVASFVGLQASTCCCLLDLLIVEYAECTVGQMLLVASVLVFVQ